MYSALTYDVMKSYLTRVWNKKIRNGYFIIGNKGCYVIKIRRLLYDNFNPLPKDKILALSKFESICSQQYKRNSKIEHFMEWVENNMGKGENAGYQCFRPFSCFRGFLS